MSPWAEASAEKRGEVARLLEQPADENTSAPLAEDDERYEDLRFKRLRADEESVKPILEVSSTAFEELTGVWEQYQSTVAELELRMKDAEVLLESAEQISAFKNKRFKSEDGGVRFRYWKLVWPPNGQDSTSIELSGN